MQTGILDDGEQWIAFKDTPIKSDFTDARIQLTTWVQSGIYNYKYNYGGFLAKFISNKTIELNISYLNCYTLEQRVIEVTGISKVNVPYFPKWYTWWLWSNDNIVELCQQVKNFLQHVIKDHLNIFLDMFYPESNKLECLEENKFLFEQLQEQHNFYLEKIRNPSHDIYDKIDDKNHIVMINKFGETTIELVSFKKCELSRSIDSLEDICRENFNIDTMDKHLEVLAKLHEETKEWCNNTNVTEIEKAESLLNKVHFKLLINELAKLNDDLDYLVYKIVKVQHDFYICKAELDLAKLNDAMKLDDIESIISYDHGVVTLLLTKKEAMVSKLDYLEQNRIKRYEKLQKMLYKASKANGNKIAYGEEHVAEYKRHQDLLKTIEKEKLTLKQIQDAILAHQSKHELELRKILNHGISSQMRREKFEYLSSQNKSNQRSVNIAKRRIGSRPQLNLPPMDFSLNDPPSSDSLPSPPPPPPSDSLQENPTTETVVKIVKPVEPKPMPMERKIISLGDLLTSRSKLKPVSRDEKEPKTQDDMNSFFKSKLLEKFKTTD